MSEGLPKQPKPTAEELERARAAHEAADPTAFSQLPPDLLVPTGEHTRAYHRSIATDGQDSYVPVEKNPIRQQVVSRLLKGVVNVADVIEGPGGTAYSKILPHEKIASPHSPDEIAAEVELLHLVLGDTDHRYLPPMEMDDIEHNNLRVEGGRASYYDFEHAELGSLPIGFKSKEHTEGSLTVLLEKLDALEKHLSGGEGLRLIAGIVEGAGKSLYQLFPNTNNTEDPERFQDGLLRRIAHAKFLVRQELAELEEKKAA